LVLLDVKFRVIVVPVPTDPDASNFHIATPTPASAAPFELTYSAIFVQVPVPPLTDVFSLLSPSAVEVLSNTDTRMAKSPLANVLVAVSKV
jgi:hypothetical protein